MMSAIEAAVGLIEMVRGNRNIANHGDGCDADTIIVAERDLGFTFPPSYRRVIEEFGTWDIAGEEFLGVYQTPAMGQKLLGSVTETLDARSQYGMPSDLIVVMFDGMGSLIVLDSSQVNQEGEYPVLEWNPGVADRQSMERLGDDFGSFALSVSAGCESLARIQLKLKFRRKARGLARLSDEASAVLSAGSWPASPVLRAENAGA